MPSALFPCLIPPQPQPTNISVTLKSFLCFDRQFRPQAHEWAVFIFLYNEGLKIRHQLMRFR